MKNHKNALTARAHGEPSLSDACDDSNEVIAQHIISIRDLESCIMRQGKVLKAIGTPNPYPNSKDPTSTIVDPTADGLTM